MSTTTLQSSFFIEVRTGFLDTRLRDLPDWLAVRVLGDLDFGARWVQIGPILVGWQEPVAGEPVYSGFVDWAAAQVRALLGRR